MTVLFSATIHNPVEKFDEAGQTVNVKDFGARGDGTNNDTEAISRAIMESGGMVHIPNGRYRITETIEVPLSETGRISICGNTGTGTVVMEGAGPAFRFVGTHHGSANPGSVGENVWRRERMPLVENLESRELIRKLTVWNLFIQYKLSYGVS